MDHAIREFNSPRLHFLKVRRYQVDKRRITNIIGIVVFGTIIIGVATQRGFQWYEEKEQLRKEQEKIRNAEINTDNLANNLAAAFVVDGSGDLVMKWARGEYLDNWGHPFVIKHNSKENGACVQSYGIDGLKDTGDDIFSRIYDYKKNRFKIETRPAKVKTKVEEIKDSFEKAKSKLGEAIKNSSNEFDKQSFEFHFQWGNKDE